VSDPAPNFEGHEGRECGEHRTVGSHRAWCHDCTEWCYPELPCRGCKIPQLEAELQKRDKEHFDSLVKAESECLEETEQLSAKLTEANKLLEQTIEVLEGFEKVATPDLPLPRIVITWWRAKARPHLTKLKER
jgi:hypothetical protein